MHKLIHIHANKTGGTSIRRTLGLTNQPEHVNAMRAKAYAGKAFDDACVFGVRRNPYHRAVSMYEYRKRINHRGLADAGIVFTDWLIATFVRGNRHYRTKDKFWQPLAWWFMDTDHKVLLLDYVLDFDYLAEDLFAMLEKECIPLPERMLHEKKNPAKTPIEDYYTNITNVQVIEQYWGCDFPLFGYKKLSEGGTL